LRKKERSGKCKRSSSRVWRRVNTEVRRQEKLNIVEKRDFRRKELSEKYTAKMLYDVVATTSCNDPVVCLLQQSSQKAI